MDKWLGPVLGLIVVGVVTYLVYWIFKTVSYELFYESMVEDTIRELVKSGALIK